MKHVTQTLEGSRTRAGVTWQITADLLLLLLALICFESLGTCSLASGNDSESVK